MFLCSAKQFLVELHDKEYLVLEIERQAIEWWYKEMKTQKF